MHMYIQEGIYSENARERKIIQLVKSSIFSLSTPLFDVKYGIVWDDPKPLKYMPLDAGIVLVRISLTSLILQLRVIPVIFCYFF